MSVGILPVHLAPTFQLEDDRIVPVDIATAPNYKSTDLCDGTLGRAWRTNDTATVFRFNLLFPTPRPVSFCGVFDVRTYREGASPRVLYVRCGDTIYSSGAPWIAESEPRRGDAGMTFKRRTADTWYVEIGLSSSASISVGEIVLGDPLLMPRHFRAWTRDDRRATIRNGDYATKAAQRRMHLECDWAALTEDDHGALLEAIDPADGALRPVVLIPDLDTPAEVYHGTLGDSHPHAQGPDPYHTGHGLEFVESRRPLGY